MPEISEVRTIADWLITQLVGKQLFSIGYSDQSRYAKTGLPGHDELEQLLPMTIIDIDTKGKKIIFMLEREVETEEGKIVIENAFLISSLMMEGRWVLDEEKHCDLWLEVGEDRKKIFFQDSRHFGLLDIALSEEALTERLSDVGPDFLRDSITLEDYTDKIDSICNNKRLRKQKKVGIFLMEQEHFSGVGNYLRAEILYAAKISPHRTLNELSDDDIKALYDNTFRIINESYDAQGATLATYKNPHGGKGGFQVVVYGKKKDPLGNEVITEDIGDKRSTHWVPTVQI